MPVYLFYAAENSLAASGTVLDVTRAVERGWENAEASKQHATDDDEQPPCWVVHIGVCAKWVEFFDCNATNDATQPRPLEEDGCSEEKRLAALATHQTGKLLVGAASRGAASLVQLLLDNDADPDTRDEAGNTALMVAAELCHSNVADVLIRAGADHRLQNKAGKTAWDVWVRMCDVGF
jgi:hypothetical protein